MMDVLKTVGLIWLGLLILPLVVFGTIAWWTYVARWCQTRGLIPVQGGYRHR